MREKSSERPPRGALIWPSSEVPAPNGMIGTRWVRATRTTSLTSSWLSTQITASGGWLGIQVMVLACWRRIASPVCSRSPKRWRSTAMAVATSSALPLLAACVAISIPCPSLACRSTPARCLRPALGAPGACWRTMFTQSCCDVKAHLSCGAARYIDLRVQRDNNRCAARGCARGDTDHASPISLRLGAQRLAASNENVPNVPDARGGGRVGLQRARAGNRRGAGDRASTTRRPCWSASTTTPTATATRAAGRLDAARGVKRSADPGASRALPVSGHRYRPTQAYVRRREGAQLPSMSAGSGRLRSRHLGGQEVAGHHGFVDVRRRASRAIGVEHLGRIERHADRVGGEPGDVRIQWLDCAQSPKLSACSSTRLRSGSA